jgi:hypothetical protein
MVGVSLLLVHFLSLLSPRGDDMLCPSSCHVWTVPNTNDFAMTPRLLPFLEQTPLYNALNMSHTFGNTSGGSSDPDSSNVTVEGR